MPWWSGVLIWAGCVLVLVAVLALCLVRLYRKAMALVGEADELQRLLDELGARADAIVAPATPDENAVTRGLAAVEEDRARIRSEIDGRKLARRDARLARARRLTAADPMQFAHLARK